MWRPKNLLFLYICADIERVCRFVAKQNFGSDSFEGLRTISSNTLCSLEFVAAETKDKGSVLAENIWSQSLRSTDIVVFHV